MLCQCVHGPESGALLDLLSSPAGIPNHQPKLTQYKVQEHKTRDNRRLIPFFLFPFPFLSILPDQDWAYGTSRFLVYLHPSSIHSTHELLAAIRAG